MLFTRLFNWIKYKTLPPSVLFLNRLFVERDSKHRRVTSNLGLTFRNSKWSTYARTNINLSSRTSYVGALLKLAGLLLAFFTILYFNSFYNLFQLQNSVYSILWFVSDSDLYLKVIFSSSLLCTAQLLLSQFLSNVFSIDGFTARSEAIDTVPVSLPKRLHKPVLHAWLTSDHPVGDFEQLFDTSITSPDSTQFELYNTLYRSSFFLSKSNESLDTVTNNLSLLESQPGSRVLKYTDLVTTSELSNPRTNSLLLEHIVLKKSDSTYSDYFNELDTWTLAQTNNELNSSGIISSSVTGQFYLPTYSYSNLNSSTLAFPELSNLKKSVTNQLSLIQWNRWLYKYNILHRSVLRASTSMTLAKRLLSSGFYSSSLSTNNIWAASALGSNKLQSEQFASLHRSLYGDFTGFDLSNSKSLNTPTGFMSDPELANLKFYELSYHWFIQRFYALNTLSSNGITVSKQLNTSALNTSLTAAQQYTSSYSDFMFTLSQTRRPSTSILDSTVLESVSINETPSKLQSTEDLYLSYKDNSLLTKHKLEVCQNLLKNSSVGENKFFAPRLLK